MSSEISDPKFGLVRSVYLRSLGLIFFIAFASFYFQAQGLIGSEGILPIASYLSQLEHSFIDKTEIIRYPTLFWLDSSDSMVTLLPQIGIALSAGLMIGLMPAISLFALAITYLSLIVAGQSFLSFQWDILLVEAAWLSIPFAGWQFILSSDAKRPPHGAAIWMLRLLVFKLMFLSGAVKLLSGDLNWANLSALQYHFETQPLPLVTSWFMHQFPSGVLKSLTLAMFAIELLLPFLIFFGRTARLISFLFFVALQIGIFATGNYGFFNLLTIALCLPLLDDRSLRFLLLQSGEAEHYDQSAHTKPAVMRGVLTWCIALCVLVFNAMVFFDTSASSSKVRAVATFSQSFHMANTYGLFAIMTTDRDEIVIEGSIDSSEWKPYHFKWKPGAVQNAPRFIAPHMPRLDWLMWFAALSSCDENPWLLRLMDRIMLAEPTVLDLLEQNPFEDRPPRYLRAMRYRYSFTDPNERKATGDWWHREPIELYCPVFEYQ